MAYTVEEVLRVISDEEEVLWEEINSSDDNLGMDSDEEASGSCVLLLHESNDNQNTMVVYCIFDTSD